MNLTSSLNGMTSFMLLVWMNEIISPLSSLLSSVNGMSARFSSNWNIYKEKNVWGCDRNTVEQTIHILFYLHVLQQDTREFWGVNK